MRHFHSTHVAICCCALTAFPILTEAARTTPQLGGTQCPTAALQTGATIRSADTIVVYGREVRLSGRFNTPSARQRVAVLAQRYDEASPKAIAVVETSADGTWSYAATPAVRTSFRACWVTAHVVSPQALIQVRPRVNLARRTAGFYTHVVGARSFGGKKILLQRKSGRHWIAIKRGTLRRRVERFQISLPTGTSRLRAYFPRQQAGPGYLAGFSRVLIVRR